MERTAQNRVIFGADAKKKNPETRMVTGFFDGGECGIRTHVPLRTTAFRVGVAIQTLAENKRSSTTMQELKNPYKIKAFSLLKG